MKHFQTGKRLVALLLSLVMLLGLLPVTALAAEDATHYLVFATDRHSNDSIIGSILSKVEEDGADVEYVGLGGDMVDGQGNYNTSAVQGEVKAVFPNASVDITKGSHDSGANDDAGILCTSSGLIETGEDYYVYGVTQSDMENAFSAQSAAAAFVNWANGADVDASKVIIVLSHLPIHAKRGDNQGAGYWHNALNTVATGSADGTEVVRNVIFFHGHNHTVDREEYFYNVGDTMSVESYISANSLRLVADNVGMMFDSELNASATYSGTGSTIYYTYATAGYLNNNKYATLVTINDDTITLTKYSTAGTSELGTVTRAAQDTSVEDDGEDESSEDTESTVGTEGTESTEGTEGTDNTESTVPAPTTATVTGATTTENKTVYVLVSAPTAGNQYLIVSSGAAGSGYALKENTTTGSSITINLAGNGISAPYIETADETIMWNAASGMTFQSEDGSYYLRLSERKLSFSTRRSTRWTVGTNSLRCESGRNTYYVRCSNGTWSASTNTNNVYFYEKQTVTVTTSANGTYSIAGNPAEVEKVVVNGTTVTLGSALTFVPESGATKTTDTSATATYTIYNDPSGIISGISGNTVTFSGIYGEALVKVNYTITVNGTDYPVDNYIVVTAKEPAYEIEITKDDAVVTEVIAVKGVTSATTLQLGNVVTYETADTTETITPAAGTIEWEVSDETIATVDQNGRVTFKGVTGTVDVTVSYKVADGKYVTDTITISANTSSYTTPDDSTNDFPEFPNPGAIRFDKTASAVGNFSETGIAQVELSMTGIPVQTGSAIDVVMMLDMTGSMTRTRIAALKAAAKLFLSSIVKNDDGSYNENRIAIYYFNVNGTTEITAMTAVTSDTQLATLESGIDNMKQAFGGTPYATALSKCQSVLNAAKTDGTGNDRQQFCVFMSDGEPASSNAYTDINGNTYTSAYAIVNAGIPAEKYSTEMKADGVTVYTVGLGITNTNYQTIINKIASDSAKAYQVADADAVNDMQLVFSNIATEIRQAATNIQVEDKITDDYTIIFSLPAGVSADDLPNGQEFYIEVVNYTLDDEHERTTYETLQKIYLAADASGNYYAASDANGTAFATPVYEAVAEGEKGYYDENGKYYADGTGTHNMVSGAYASGNSETTIIIATPYFYYDASTKILNWTASVLSEGNELALRYFLHLEGSVSDEIDAGTYPTNEYATITYTNHNGNECQQTFPVPQLTWNGAQVSYVFYLVNSAGQPINKSGQVVDFANATFITDVFTQSVTWNEEGGVTALEAIKKAAELLPGAYSLYDESTVYEIHVHQTENGTDINHFVITAGNGTTKVYNTKAGTKYSDPGTYTAENVFEGFDFANTTVAFAVVWEPALVEDTVVVDFGLDVVINVVQNDLMQNTVSGIGLSNAAYGNVAMNTGVSTTSKLGTSALTTADGSTISIENENAVRFHQNDMTFSAPVTFYYESPVEFYEGSNKQEGFMYSSVTVIPATTIYYEDNFLNYTDSAVATETSGKWSAETSTDKTQDADRPGDSLISDALDADNVYGFDSAYTDCTTFSQGASRYVTVDAATGAMDVAPTAEFKFTGTAFDIISVTDNTTGTILVDIYNADGAKVDALIVDTYYGYTATQATGDEAYRVITWKYSNGAWHIAETAYAATAAESGQPSINPSEGETFVVYEKNITWTVATNDPNALYQIPVIKADLGTYGTYTVKITVQYLSALDHNKDGSYTFYLDAIRIYNPAQGNEKAEAVYALDGEGKPEYKELRDLLISAEDFDTAADSVNGAVFIDGFGTTDSISDYTDVGPSNEVYLAKGQAVAFQLSNDNAANLASVQLALKAVNGNANYTVATANGKTLLSGTAATATDLYYKLDGLTWTNGVSDTIIITNTGDGILSITNLKFTYKAAPATTTDVVTSKAAASAAVYAVRSLLLPEAKYFAPETLSVKLSNTSVSKGAFVTVTITTSADVASLTVNGNKVVRCTTNSRNGTKVWRATVMATEVGVQKISVVAYDVEGLASKPEIARLTVQNGRVIWWKSAFGIAE